MTSSLNFPRSLSLLCAALALTACAPPPSMESPAPDAAPPPDDAAEPTDASPVVDVSSPTDATPTIAPRERCEAPAPADTVAIGVYRDGVVFAVNDGTAGHTERWQGGGCAITRTSVSAVDGVLLDVDDAGNAYLLREGDALVSRVAEGDVVTDIVRAGRGIWAFGASPSGHAMWVTSCGPTGIFAMDDIATPLMGDPGTLWQMEPAVLTADDVFWSVGTRSCAPTDAVSPACGYVLTRTTASESRAVGTTVVDFGAGYERGQIARCGAGVCGLFPSGVIAWDEEGGVVTTLRTTDFGPVDGERIVQIAGNTRGVYALLEGGVARRVVFVPTAHAR